MNKIILLLFCIGIAIPTASAATIPAGTMLTVRTSITISSRDSAGKQFQGKLAEAITVNGTVVLSAGTHVLGVVQSPLVRIASTTRPLTLKLTQVSVGNRILPVKTDPFEVKDTSPWTGRRGRVQITGSAFLIPSGTTLQFQLKQPLNL